GFDAVRAGRDDGDGRPDEDFEAVEVRLRVLGQIGERFDAERALLPARVFLVDRLANRQRFRPHPEPVALPALPPFAPPRPPPLPFDPPRAPPVVEPAARVAFCAPHPKSPLSPGAAFHPRRTDPAAATRPPSARAIFVAAHAQPLADFVVELRRERTGTNAGR